MEWRRMGGTRTGVRRGGQTVGNIIAARAERNYRFALGVPSFFPIPPSSSLESAKASSFFLYPSAFLPPGGLAAPAGHPSSKAPAQQITFIILDQKVFHLEPRWRSIVLFFDLRLAFFLPSPRSPQPPSFCFSSPPLRALFFSPEPFLSRKAHPRKSQRREMKIKIDFDPEFRAVDSHYLWNSSFSIRPV